MVKNRLVVFKILHAIFFCIIFPLLLLFWASFLNVEIPMGQWVIFGYILGVSGLVFLSWGMWNLWIIGNGLPMNAFPPSTFVVEGAYKIFKHPIYVGFCLMLGGASLLLHSSSGFYVVTPVLILLCTGLVLGYEKHDLQKRFGLTKHHTFFGVPQEDGNSIKWIERIGVFCSAFMPWFILYKLLIFLGIDEGFFNTMLPFESRVPVVEWLEIPYSLTYVFVVLCPFIIKGRTELRMFLTRAWIATAIGIFLQFIFPFYSKPRAFIPKTIFGEIILLEQAWDGPAAAFPSFHVIWALLAAWVWIKTYSSYKHLSAGIAVLIIISCVGTGIHSVADVISGISVAIVVFKWEEILKAINSKLEVIANSWKEKRFGSFRIINHSIYAGIAASVGVLILGQLSIEFEAILVIVISAAVGAMLWGQFVEGSPMLLRPFGYFGAIAGGLIGLMIITYVSGKSFLTYTAAVALAAPIVQAIGRFRCLVQGCCHGAPSKNGEGIMYLNLHSRVCKISGLRGQPLHNTQLYSIFFSLIIGLVLWRFWYAGVSSAMITGLYFIFSGVARFIEEAYRGEVQTKIVSGLRFYQWISIVIIVAGILLTCIPDQVQPNFRPYLDTELCLVVVFSGIVWAFAMGMDFPNSNIRFSRLSD